MEFLARARFSMFSGFALVMNLLKVVWSGVSCLKSQMSLAYYERIKWNALFYNAVGRSLNKVQKRVFPLCVILCLLTISLLTTGVLAQRGPPVPVPNVVVTIFNNEPFDHTDFTPKESIVDLPEGTWNRVLLTYKAVSKGDPWDRAYSVAAKGIELHRGITRFGGSISSSEDVTAYIAILKGTVTFQSFITTYTTPGWTVTVKLEFYAGSSPSVAGTITPVWLWQWFGFDSTTPKSQSNQIEFPASAPKKAILVVYATQHNYEEGVRRMISIKVGGTEIARISTTTWRPGQGRVAPYVVDVTQYVGQLAGTKLVTVEIVNGRSYWVVSTCFQLTTT